MANASGNLPGPGTLTIILIGLVVIGSSFDQIQPVVMLLLFFVVVGLLLEAAPKLSQYMSGHGFLGYVPSGG